MTDWRVQEAVAGRYYDEDGRPVGLLGVAEKPVLMLHRLNWFGIALKNFAPPEVSSAYKRVPDDYVEEDVEDGVYLAKVRCPCGEEHLVELGQDRTFDCNRHFFFQGAPGRVGRRAVFAMQMPVESSDS